MKRALQRLWWRSEPPPLVLRGLAVLYGAVADGLASRRRAAAEHLPVPVIVVGNLAVGGTGKTPITLYLVEQLRAMGRRPGVLSRGYGGSGPFPLLVDAGTAPERCGDEPALLAQRARVPLCVAPSRVAAGQALLAAHPEIDVLLCDDGLQHYALARDLELCVIDGQRGHGNGHRLPAGPLREPVARAADCALLLVNGGDAAPYGERALRFDLVADRVVALHGEATRPLASFAGETVDAIAGIGAPQRFFDQLRGLGIVVREHAFDDHHAYTDSDLAFAGRAPLLMTEKDAVKCRRLNLPSSLDAWAVPVEAQFSRDDAQRVQECLRSALAPR